MTGGAVLLAAVLVLGAGTLALRLTGPALRSRLEPTPWLQAQIDRSVTVLLSALILTSALLDGRVAAGVARPAAVAVAAVLAWKRAPFVVVVVVATVVASALRLVGVP